MQTKEKLTPYIGCGYVTEIFPEWKTCKKPVRRVSGKVVHFCENHAGRERIWP